jgi:hypothetical protein
MDKTLLEKRIEERAEKRFKDDLRILINDIQKNPIGKSLTILINGKPVELADSGINFGLINNNSTKGNYVLNTNLKEIKEKLVDEYKKEETDSILDKLTNIDYLFQNQ